MNRVPHGEALRHERSEVRGSVEGLRVPCGTEIFPKMIVRSSTPDPEQPQFNAALRMPPGAPGWVTLELIAKTIQTFQKHYTEVLTPEIALEMILGVGQLFHVLSSGSQHEAISGPGSGEQP